jgi:uncharacterized membrane protein
VRAWTDRQIEEIIGKLLRTGVLLAAGVIIFGGALYLWQYGAAMADYRVFRGEPPALRSPAAIVRSALAGDPRGVIELGLLVLVGTPVARVALSAWAFAAQGDRLYLAITLIVLAILCYSLLTGA